MTEYERGFIDGVRSKVAAELTPVITKMAGGLNQTIQEVVKTVIGNVKITAHEPASDDQPVKWISVKDRLPEDDGKYMVWYKGELDICEFDVESQTFGYTYDDYDEMYSHLVCWDDGMDKDITHWMPLPEPPKDGDTECHDTK